MQEGFRGALKRPICCGVSEAGLGEGGAALCCRHTGGCSWSPGVPWSGNGPSELCPTEARGRGLCTPALISPLGRSQGQSPRAPDNWEDPEGRREAEGKSRGQAEVCGGRAMSCFRCHQGSYFHTDLRKPYLSVLIISPKQQSQRIRRQTYRKGQAFPPAAV